MKHRKELEIYNFNLRAKYWLVRADGGKYYDDFKYNHFISIHHNEVTLQDLETSELLLTAEKTIEHYKKTIANIYEKQSLTKHQITFTAKRLYCFIEEMSIGDYVVVPSHKSNYFLIGQITSEVFEQEETEALKLNHGYASSTDIKRRKVRWINEVSRQKINSKFLYSTLTVHHTIFNITDLSRYIDGLISPLYIKDGKLHLKLNINTNQPVTSDMWQALYSVINSCKSDQFEEEITATANVESPGEVLLTSINQFLSDPIKLGSSALLVLTLLFGEVDTKGIKLKGALPLIKDWQKHKEEVRKAKIENDNSQLDLDSKRDNQELEKIKLEIEKKKAQRELRALDITIDNPSVNYATEDQMRTDSHEILDEE